MLPVEAREEGALEIEELFLRHPAFAGFVEIIETRRSEDRARPRDDREALLVDIAALLGVCETIELRHIAAPLIAGEDSVIAAPFARCRDQKVVVLLGERRNGAKDAHYGEREDDFTHQFLRSPNAAPRTPSEPYNASSSLPSALFQLMDEAGAKKRRRPKAPPLVFPVLRSPTSSARSGRRRRSSHGSSCRSRRPGSSESCRRPLPDAA